MRYHIDTIPVWDVIKSACDCPLCLLWRQVEEKSVTFFNGASVMEPDIRIQVNHEGFCAHHQQALYEQKNRLGHALMMLSHAQETLEQIKQMESSSRSPGKSRFGGFGKSKAASGGNTVSSGLSRISESCIICRQIDENFQSYLYTFIHLYRTDAAFVKAFSDSKGLCIPHTAVLLNAAQSELSGEQFTELQSLLLKKIRLNLEKTIEDLDFFTRKFDYRNADLPWGNSKDANERMINLINGHCIGTVKTK